MTTLGAKWRSSADRTVTNRDVPLLVQSAARCLDYHRRNKCWRCTDTGLCPMVVIADSRIWAWRRYRALNRRWR